MLKDSQAFSSFSVKDLAGARAFYTDVLGLECEDTQMGFELKTTGNNGIFVYQKDDHQPATFTVLNFAVADIDKAVEALEAKGVKFEHYDLGDGAVTDETGVLRGKSANMGPDIAWFKDPAGNVFSVLSS
jgi:catechol 2,3-dioxygenase-like lactoylglutathione lyase family enzyme